MVVFKRFKSVRVFMYLYVYSNEVDVFFLDKIAILQ